MSDSWSPYPDTAVDLQPRADQLLALRDRLLSCAENLEANGYSESIVEETAKELLHAKKVLTEFECGLQFAKDLAVTNQLVASRTDHRSVEVVRSCLQQFSVYLSEVAHHGTDRPAALLLAFNELSALQKKALLTDSLFTVPDNYRIDADTLPVVEPGDAETPVSDRYLGFSQTMLGVYRGENRRKKLIQLADSFENLSLESSDNKSARFWQLCRVFTSTLAIPKGELSLALFRIFKEIEGVLFYALSDPQSPVLGMQQNVDRLLVSMLCYTYQQTDDSSTETLDEWTGFSGVLDELNALHQSSPESLSPWLETSISVLAERLQHCAAILSEEALDSDESVAEFIAETTLLKRLLILLGVHGVRENLEEVERYIRQSVTSETMQSCRTSVQLVEQQMLYQFGFLSESASVASTHETPVQAMAYGHGVDESEAALNTAQDFGTHCNLCIDVIQQSLDTALGSSGNLIPDTSVVNALNKLQDIVADEGIDELTNLLTPLSQLLIKAQDSTLNQSDTLLVQEAIIAATLGIDSLVGQKPMPALVQDVTTRVEEVLESTSQRLSKESPRNRSLSGFLIEAEELLPRLFELLQRLRGAPQGASRLYADINRLLHAFKYSADEAEEQELAELAHYLESIMVDLTQSEATPSQAFFDLAIESIECLGEDVEHLRNSESTGDRSDLIDRLRLVGTVEEELSPTVQQKRLLPENETQASSSHADSQVDSVAASQATEIAEKQVVAVPQVGAELVGGSDLSTAPHDPSGAIDWSERFRKLEACCNAIGNSHRQLLELQNKTDQILQTINSDQDSSSTESKQALHSFAQQLEQITEIQSVAVNQLSSELGTAAMLDTGLLRSALLAVVDEAATSCHLKVQFAFQSDGAQIHRNLFDQLSEALAGLLKSVVTYTIAVRDKATSESATLLIDIQQNESMTIIDITDDGCGVSVQGTPPRSDNPWAQVARPDWRELDHNQARNPPQVWSKQTDHTIDITGLLKVATRYGGTVAVGSNDEETRYRLCIPVLQNTQNVLVFSLRSHLLAIPAARVTNVGLANGASAISMAQLIGVKKQSAFDTPCESHCISVRTPAGVHQYTVDTIHGHQSLEFSAAERILPDVPGYLGVSVTESEQLVKLLDIDYWNAQQS